VLVELARVEVALGGVSAPERFEQAAALARADAGRAEPLGELGHSLYALYACAPPLAPSIAHWRPRPPATCRCACARGELGYRREPRRGAAAGGRPRMRPSIERDAPAEMHAERALLQAVIEHTTRIAAAAPRCPNRTVCAGTVPSSVEKSPGNRFPITIPGHTRFP
jgi:hypothetical protein